MFLSGRCTAVRLSLSVVHGAAVELSPGEHQVFLRVLKPHVLLNFVFSGLFCNGWCWKSEVQKKKKEKRWQLLAWHGCDHRMVMPIISMISVNMKSVQEMCAST